MATIASCNVGILKKETSLGFFLAEALVDNLAKNKSPATSQGFVAPKGLITNDLEGDLVDLINF